MADTVELDVVAFGVAFSALYGLFMFVTGIFAWQLGWGVEMVQLAGSLYLGFAPTLAGSVIGLVWGALDGFALGVFLAWVYNTVARYRS